MGHGHHTHHAVHSEHDALLKSISIVAIYLVGMGFALLPVTLRAKFSGSRHYTTFLGLANAFAAGVFLSMGLIHLLPEGEARLQDFYGDDNIKYRISYLMCVVGYAAILTLERVVFTTPSCAHHMHMAVHQEDASAPSSAAQLEAKTSATIEMLASQKQKIKKPRGAVMSPEIKPAVDRCIQDTAPPCHAEGTHYILRCRERIVAAIAGKEAASHCVVCEDKEHRTAGLDVASKARSTSSVALKPSKAGTGESEHKTVDSTVPQITGTDDNVSIGLESDQVLEVPPVISKEHRHTHLYPYHEVRTGTIQPYVLMAALGAHGLSEGLALGVERGKHHILFLFFAIVAHKWAEGLALGISFSKTEIRSKKIVALLCAFSLSTPIGVGIGWLAQALLPKCAEGYFLGFSSGSFLYIGASEVVVEEFIQGQRHWRKLFFFCIGIALIYVVTTYLDFC